MTTYELRIHARDVTIAESGNVDIGNHTGLLSMRIISKQFNI